MHTRNSRGFLTVAVLGTALFIPAVGRADLYQFQAYFDGLQMSPPNASPAFGSATATLDSISGAFSITDGSYLDLLGGSNSIFLNGAAPGNNGPLLATLTNDTPGAKSGTFSGNASLTGGGVLFLTAGEGYLRVTSAVFPSGEIRGQLFVLPESGTLLLAGIGTLGCLGLRRMRRDVA